MTAGARSRTEENTPSAELLIKYCDEEFEFAQQLLLDLLSVPSVAPREIAAQRHLAHVAEESGLEVEARPINLRRLARTSGVIRTGMVYRNRHMGNDGL